MLTTRKFSYAAVQLILNQCQRLCHLQCMERNISVVFVSFQFCWCRRTWYSNKSYIPPVSIVVHKNHVHIKGDNLSFIRKKVTNPTVYQVGYTHNLSPLLLICHEVATYYIGVSVWCINILLFSLKNELKALVILNYIHIS